MATHQEFPNFSTPFRSGGGYRPHLIALIPPSAIRTANLKSQLMAEQNSQPMAERNSQLMAVENVRADGQARLQVESVRADGRACLHVESARADGRANLNVENVRPYRTVDNFD